MSRQRVLTVFILLILAAPLIADSVYLKNGTCLKGTITAEHPDRIEMKLESGEAKTIPRSEIAMIKKGSAPTEEYRKRLKATDEKDLDAMIALASWCGENNLKRQSVAVLRKVLKLDEDHPMSRRALKMTWTGSKWSKDKKKNKVGAPTAASQLMREKMGLKLTPPAAWQVKDTGETGLALTGPERYRQPVKIEILLSSAATSDAFKAEAEGWSEPQAVTYGKLAGFVAERTHGDKHRLLRSREYALAGNGWAHTVRLTALDVEMSDWVPHVELVLKSFVVMAPKLDFKNSHLGIGFRFPQNAGWNLNPAVGPDKKPIGFFMVHSGEDALAYARMFYLQPPLDAVPEDLEEYLKGMAKGEDVKNKWDTKLGTLKARAWETDGLESGIPVRNIYLVAVQGKKFHQIQFACHERSIDEFRAVFNAMIASFVISG
jgi:hypothetical protein